MRVRDGEEGLSVSRSSLTSPLRLLNLLELQGKSPVGWRVCRISVRDVRSLDLDVRPDPKPEDPGHCLIVGTIQNPLTKRMSAKLAQFTRVLSPDDIV